MKTWLNTFYMELTRGIYIYIKNECKLILLNSGSNSIGTCGSIVNLTLSVKWVDEFFGSMTNKIDGWSCPLRIQIHVLWTSKTNSTQDCWFGPWPKSIYRWSLWSFYYHREIYLCSHGAWSRFIATMSLDTTTASIPCWNKHLIIEENE